MIEFKSQVFLDACKQEISEKGYCYLRESLSRCGGMSIEYLIEKDEELDQLPVREKSLWNIFVADQSPFATDIYLDCLMKMDCVELQDYEPNTKGKIIDANWVYGATIKMVALVYQDGQAVLGSY